MSKATTVEKNGRFYKRENGEILTENELLKEWLVVANEQLEEYKSRIEKAVEYIKEHIKYECDDAFNGMQFYSYHLYNFSKDDLLNILNGKE